MKLHLMMMMMVHEDLPGVTNYRPMEMISQLGKMKRRGSTSN